MADLETNETRAGFRVRRVRVTGGREELLMIVAKKWLLASNRCHLVVNLSGLLLCISATWCGEKARQACKHD